MLRTAEDTSPGSGHRRGTDSRPAPYSGTEVDLMTGDITYEAEGIPVKKRKIASDVFSRLLAAGQRLLAVIQHNEGGTNKDLAKFTDQINTLCDKWDR